MAEQKNVNYTDEQTEALVAAYVAADSAEARDAVVEAQAEALGKTTRSIRAKLVREGVYVKKVYKTKTGGKPETKESIVGDIAATLGVDADSKLGGLEKANKNALQLIRATLLIAMENTLNEEESPE